MRRRKNFILNKPAGTYAHHIVPLHAGGIDDPSNIEFLTLEEHINAHKELYEKYGRWQDLLACQMLSGQVGKEEGIRIAQRNADKSWMKTEEGRALMKEAQRRSREAGNRPEPWNKGLTKETDPRLYEYSIRSKLHQEQGKIHSIGDAMRGTKFSNEHRKNLASAAKNRTRIVCEYCSKEVTPNMFSRWHGEKCKKNPNLEKTSQL